MKFIGNTITVARALRGALISQEDSTRYLRPRGALIALLMLAILIGFNAIIAVRAHFGVLVLPLDGMLGGSLLSFLFLDCVKTAPSAAGKRNLREIDVADLLEREVVPLEIGRACPFLRGQVILVTGAAGSIGSELCRQLLDCEPGLLIALDTNETGLFDLVEGLRSRAHPYIACLHPFIGDITDVQRMARLLAEKRPDIVFHAAAYKHVPLLEQYPDLAVRTNALATYHLCRLAREYEVEHFVFVSTDKAAEPVSVMGASKRLAEMIVQAMATSTRSTTRFCTVRFGNVIGSRGSVVPIFAQQIEQGGPLTVTDPQATRYFMTIPEACRLVILISAIAEQGGLYLLNMGEPVRIIDLAIKMVNLCGLRMGRDISIVYTGLRPGERLHETLIAANEELTHTAYTKILSVVDREAPPTLETVTRWLATLEKSLQQEDVTELRECLFEFVRREDLKVSSDYIRV